MLVLIDPPAGQLEVGRGEAEPAAAPGYEVVDLSIPTAPAQVVTPASEAVELGGQRGQPLL